MEKDFLIRIYSGGDREALRRICCDNADKGGPVENFFSDREIFADLVCSYYTDFEPGSLLVASADNQVVGYLMGCLDTRKYNRIMAVKLVPRIFLRALLKGSFLRHDTWHLIHGMFKSISLGGFKRSIPLDRYPAHLHVNVHKDYRGRQIGQGLVGEFFKFALIKGVKGIHLSVREDNHSGRKFFEKVGFHFLEGYPMAMPQGDKFILSRTLIYVKSLEK